MSPIWHSWWCFHLPVHLGLHFPLIRNSPHFPSPSLDCSSFTLVRLNTVYEASWLYLVFHKPHLLLTTKHQLIFWSGIVFLFSLVHILWKFQPDLDFWAFLNLTQTSWAHALLKVLGHGKQRTFNSFFFPYGWTCSYISVLQRNSVFVSLLHQRQYKQCPEH